MITGVEHIAIAAHDPRGLAQWYVRNLDFRVVSDAGSTVFISAPNGCVFEVTAAAGEAVPAKKTDPGLRHVAILVDDFDAVYERLKSVPVRFDGEPFSANGNRVVFFTDPEGNYLHLIYRPTPLMP